MTSRIRQIAWDVFMAEWEQLSAGCGTKAVQASEKKQASRACSKRTSRRTFKSSMADNEQLTHEGTGDFLAWINEPAVAE
jgi:hypothetical protein